MNLGMFETEFWPGYWSSSIADGSIVNINDYSQEVNFANGSTTNIFRNSSLRVRPIRAFGILGCMDETACNFSANANMTDGSCEYAEQHYDCDGNLDVQIGDEAFGGIVFYVDETGQHALVAAMEDLSDTYEWGCWNEYVDGALGSEIGSGYQNTLDIVDANCLLGGNPVSSNLYAGINAAQACFNYEYEGYSDWYLPSKDEFALLFDNIEPSSNISGNLNSETYRVSTQHTGNLVNKDSWVFRPPATWDSAACRCFSYGVRPIRSF